MTAFAEKKYMELKPPDALDSLAGRERILRALAPAEVHMSYPALKKLPPALQAADYRVTLTLCPGQSGMDIVNVEPGDTRARLTGLALDIGSTTLQMELVDLNEGRTLAARSAINSQARVGSDILARIFAVKQDAGMLDKLRELVLKDVRELIAGCCADARIAPDEIAAMTVGGNTTMLHLFLGCDPWQVFQSPYAPVFYDPGLLHAWEIGLPLACNVFFMPAVANYLGGDITGGLLMTDLDSREDAAMFLDVGTNGELALGCRDFLLLGAGAAGPALEGAVSRSGMLAGPGAVSAVEIDEANELHIRTIGDLPPRGICGSGILDLIAQGYLAGWIRGNGTLDAEASPRIRELREADRPRPVPAIVYAEGAEGPLYFTEDDIQEYIRCKAAAHTMVATMLDASGLSADEIGTFYLSGGFGTHYNLESAITVGLYPDLPREKFKILGNSSLAGARRLLCDRGCLKRLADICERAVYLQFGEMDKFLENMVAAQFLPHTDAQKYPSVKPRRRIAAKK